MDSNRPVSKSFSKQKELVHKQIGDLRLSLRTSETQSLSSTIISDEKLGKLIDQMIVGIYHSTVDGDLVMANAALAKIFGYASPEVMMMSVKDIGSQLYVEPQQRKAWCQLFHHQEQVGPIVWRGYRNNHELIWLEEHAQVKCDAQGNILGYEGVVIDVTVRYLQENDVKISESKNMRAEALPVSTNIPVNDKLQQELLDSRETIEALQKQLDLFQIAAKGSQEGLWEAHPLPDQSWDSPETPAWYSPQFLALLGFEEHEFPPVQKSWAACIHPDDRVRVFQAMRDHIEHHVPYEVESRLKTKQGEYRWFKGKGQAIFNERGRFVRGGGTIRDITEQKEAEEAVKRKHTLLTTVVEGTSDIIFVKDHEGRYLLVNSTGATVLGCPIEEIIGKTDAELFSKRGTSAFYQI